MSPFFSIVIPTKNRLSLLKECVESILNQVFQDFEVIIVDDQSEDGTMAWVQSLKSHKIKTIRNEWFGDSGGRNTGIKHAVGRYITLIDDDDLVLETYLSDFYDYLKSFNFPSDTAVRTNFWYLKDGVKFKKSESYDKDLMNPIDFILDRFCSSCVICFPSKLIKEVQFPVGITQWQDTHFLLRFFINCKLVQLNNTNYVYRNHSQMGSRLVMDKTVLFQNALDHASFIESFHKDYNQLYFKFTRSKFDAIISKKLLEYSTNAMGKKYFRIALQLLYLSLKRKILVSEFRIYLIFLRNLIFNKSKEYS
jgi:glycosyltransferase involved in cell wall biosynthesis